MTALIALILAVHFHLLGALLVSIVVLALLGGVTMIIIPLGAWLFATRIGGTLFVATIYFGLLSEKVSPEVFQNRSIYAGGFLLLIWLGPLLTLLCALPERILRQQSRDVGATGQSAD